LLIFVFCFLSPSLSFSRKALTFSLSNCSSFLTIFRRPSWRLPYIPVSDEGRGFRRRHRAGTLKIIFCFFFALCTPTLFFFDFNLKINEKINSVLDLNERNKTTFCVDLGIRFGTQFVVVWLLRFGLMDSVVYLLLVAGFWFLCRFMMQFPLRISGPLFYVLQMLFIVLRLWVRVCWKKQKICLDWDGRRRVTTCLVEPWLVLDLDWKFTAYIWIGTNLDIFNKIIRKNKMKIG